MKSTNQTSLKIATLISLICSLIPLTIYGLWVYAFKLGSTQAERVTIFKDYFPDFLNGRWDTTFISIAFCVVAILLSTLNLKKLKNFWRTLNILIVVISSLLLFLNLFSMM